MREERSAVAPSAPIIRMEGIVKVYPPAVLALDGVDIAIEAGTIHSIVGENGAGKSTLMKLFYGITHRNAGTIWVRDREVHFATPNEAVKSGIGMVHQEFMLIPSYSVIENVMLGHEPVGLLGRLSRATARDRISELMEEHNLKIDINATINSLSIGARQKVEILKLLYRNVDVLILDEPTAVLTPQESEQLFRRLFGLKEAGKTIVFISHKLDEVLQLSDVVTVMRKGRRIITMPNRDLSKIELVQAMLGREMMGSMYKSPAKTGEALLELLHVSTEQPGGLHDITFKIHAGEIVGIAGIEGNGQSELVELLIGAKRPVEGSVVLQRVEIGHETIGKRRRHLSFVPQDRTLLGSCQSATLIENAIMTHHRRGGSLTDRLGLFLRHRACRRLAGQIADDFAVTHDDLRQPIEALSGGNQQKMIVGREFRLENRFILLDQPTRGLDVGAIEYIRCLILDRRDRGYACLLVSADLDEIFALSDRILVIYRQRIVADLDPQSQTREEVGEYMLGLRRERRR